MALKGITKILKATLKTGATGAVGAAGASAVNMLSGKDEQEIQQSGQKIKDAQFTQEKVKRASAPQVFSTETPQAVRGFAAMVQKEVEIAERVENQERTTRIYSGLQREGTVSVLLKGLKSSAIVLETKAKDAIDTVKKRQLEYQRQQDEEKAEGLGDLFDKGYDKIADFAKKMKKGILGALSPFMTPALLFGGGFLAEQLDDLIPEEYKDTDLLDTLETVENIGDRVAGATGVAGIMSTANRVGRATRATLAPTGLVKPPSNVPKVGGAQMMVDKMKANPRYVGYLNKLGAAQAWFSRLQGSANRFVAGATQWMARLPAGVQRILQKGMRKVLKWFLIFEVITALFNSTQMLVLGTITEAEWHTKNKEQIVRLIRLFGGPFLVMAIFALLGTLAGPVVGNLAGGVAGFVVGLILGDAVFDILKMDVLVNGLYDWLFLGNTETLKSYVPALLRSVAIELPKMIANFYIDVGKSIATAGATVGAKFALATMDRVATNEEIREKYGEDISIPELLKAAGEGIGTDENAMLYAFKDIDTPEKYLALKNEFETNVLPDINRNRYRKFNTMEQYLRGELSEGEYDKLRNQVTSQMQQNRANETDALNEFFRGVGYEELSERVFNQIQGIDNVSDEEYAKYQAGELTNVLLKDDTYALMTEEELLDSDKVGIAAREVALTRIRHMRSMYEDQQQRKANEELAQLQSEETPRTNLDRTASDLQSQGDYLRDMAARMGIDTTGQLTGKFVGGVPVEVNGRRVPNALFTNEERQKIRAVEEARQAMDPAIRQQQPAQPPSEPPPNIIPAAGRTATNVNVLTQNIAQQQKEQTMPFGSMPPTESTPATPSRQTNDSFIDLGYVT